MKSYNYDIRDKMSASLSQISKVKAKFYYAHNKTIYVQVLNTWLELNRKEDGDQIFEGGLKYFIKNEYDDDKIIVSRHQCVIDFFKSRGINAKVIPCARTVDVMNKTVYTTSCPLHLLSFAKDAYILNVQNVGALEFDDLTLEDLEKHKYQVRHYEINSKRVNEWSNSIDY